MMQNEYNFFHYSTYYTIYIVAMRPNTPAICVNDFEYIDKRKHFLNNSKILKKFKKNIYFICNEEKLNRRKTNYITPPAKHSKYPAYEATMMNPLIIMYDILLIWNPSQDNYKRKTWIKHIFPLFLFFMFFFQNHPT